MNACDRPHRGIFSAADLEEFKQSESYSEITKFVRLCGNAVTGLRISDVSHIPEAVASIENFMNTLEQWVDEIPPIQQPMRFGNKAFRQWHERLEQNAPDFVASLLPHDKRQYSPELLAYFSDSFGNTRRIDYGTGHEANMAFFFLCLLKIGVIRESDLAALILRSFSAYVKTMRKLQSTYLLEPAGSHGVWGLDDYHCLIFVWGSAQLVDHSEITPKSVRDSNTVSYYADEYLYLEGIRTIYRIKSSAPFAETSPMLYSISDLKDWKAVYTGMLKLFGGEVLHKLPVVQHMVFGSLLRCTWSPSGSESLPAASGSSGTSEGVPPLPSSSIDTPRQSNSSSVCQEAATVAPWASNQK